MRYTINHRGMKQVTWHIITVILFVTASFQGQGLAPTTSLPLRSSGDIGEGSGVGQWLFFKQQRRDQKKNPEEANLAKQSTIRGKQRAAKKIIVGVVDYLRDHGFDIDIRYMKEGLPVPHQDCIAINWIEEGRGGEEKKVIAVDLSSESPLLDMTGPEIEFVIMNEEIQLFDKTLEGQINNEERELLSLCRTHIYQREKVANLDEVRNIPRRIKESDREFHLWHRGEKPGEAIPAEKLEKKLWSLTERWMQDLWEEYKSEESSDRIDLERIHTYLKEQDEYGTVLEIVRCLRDGNSIKQVHEEEYLYLLEEIERRGEDDRVVKVNRAIVEQGCWSKNRLRAVVIVCILWSIAMFLLGIGISALWQDSVVEALGTNVVRGIGITGIFLELGIVFVNVGLLVTIIRKIMGREKYHKELAKLRVNYRGLEQDRANRDDKERSLEEAALIKEKSHMEKVYWASFATLILVGIAIFILGVIIQGELGEGMVIAGIAIILSSLIPLGLAIYKYRYNKRIQIGLDSIKEKLKAEVWKEMDVRSRTNPQGERDVQQVSGQEMESNLNSNPYHTTAFRAVRSAQLMRLENCEHVSKERGWVFREAPKPTQRGELQAKAEQRYKDIQRKHGKWLERKGEVRVMDRLEKPYRGEEGVAEGEVQQTGYLASNEEHPHKANMVLIQCDEAVVGGDLFPGDSELAEEFLQITILNECIQDQYRYSMGEGLGVPREGVDGSSAEDRVEEQKRELEAASMVVAIKLHVEGNMQSALELVQKLKAKLLDNTNLYYMDCRDTKAYEAEQRYWQQIEIMIGNWRSEQESQEQQTLVQSVQEVKSQPNFGDLVGSVSVLLSQA